MIARFSKLTFTLLSLVLALPMMASAQGCVEDASIDRLTFHEGLFSGSVPVVTGYIAMITNRDLYNSSGTRLGDFRAVIQQDRANVHKSGIPDGFSETEMDGSVFRVEEDIDGYFTTLQRRQILSAAQYYWDCNMNNSAELERQILNGQVPAAALWVLLFIHPNGEPAVYLSPVG